MSPKIAGVIPAKGSSTRVASKNRQTVLGVPLFLWAANNLARVLPRNDVYVDSDSPEILAEAARHGFGTIERPAELATNATDGNQLMLWEASNVEADIILQHLPPMIFLRAETIRKAIELVKGGMTSAFTVHRAQHYMWDDGGPQYDLDNVPNSFTLPHVIQEGMGFYAITREALFSSKRRIVEPYEMLQMDHYETIDIDYPDDLEYARVVARGLGPDSEWTSGIRSLVRRHRPKLLALDIDGVQTDGGMYYSQAGDEAKKFNTKDGMAIKLAVKAGIEVAFISSGLNEALIRRRADLFGIERIYVGTDPKIGIMQGWIDAAGIGWEDVAYIGDDINDAPVMEKCGLTACPADAVAEIRQVADIVLSKVGGAGCVREFVDSYLDLTHAGGHS
ncbi:MAG: N-acylneuraminate cytidylyltransferase [Pseudomonadota bacterium]